MKTATVLFAPSVDEAIVNLIDYVDPVDISVVLNFVEVWQKRLIGTLSTLPLGGSKIPRRSAFLCCGWLCLLI